MASVLLKLLAVLTSPASASSGRPASIPVDASVAPAASASDPIVGDWYVTYGNTTVVKISESGGVYTETSTEPLQVVGGSCYLPPGTVISTFHEVSAGGYSGEHGLWFTSNCSFDTEAPMTLKLEGNTLSGEVVGFALVFTRAVPDAVTSSASPDETTATVRGSVNPSGQSTTYYVAYDTSGSPFCVGGGSAATFSTPPQALSSVDLAEHPVAGELTGLSPGTGYCAAVVATNASGTAGLIATNRVFFTTVGPETPIPPPPPPPCGAAYTNGCVPLPCATAYTYSCVPLPCGTAYTSGCVSPHPRRISPTAAFALPPASECVSHRRFTIHVRTLPGIIWTGAAIKINHKGVKSVGRSHITALISLVGLPKGTFVLSITAKASDGQSVTGTRTYHTCVPKSKSHYPAPRL